MAPDVDRTTIRGFRVAREFGDRLDQNRNAKRLAKEGGIIVEALTDGGSGETHSPWTEYQAEPRSELSPGQFGEAPLASQQALAFLGEQRPMESGHFDGVQFRA